MDSNKNNSKENYKIQVDLKHNELVLTEIKDFHNQILKLKNILETKANYYIAISGIIIASLLAYLPLVDEKLKVPPISYILLLVCILIGSFTLYNAFMSLKIRNYNFPVAEKPKENIRVENIIYDLKKIKSSQDLFDKLIDEYIICSKLNSIENERKNTFILKSQKYLTKSLIIFIITVGSTFIPTILSNFQIFDCK